MPEAPVTPGLWPAARLRQLFESPPQWQPELTGDKVRFTDREPSAAAVLVALVQTPSGLEMLLTQRSAALHDHAGQIAFAGGRVDPSDPHHEHTAMREANEEIGLPYSAVEVIGRLPNYTTGTGYDITPIVALVTDPPPNWVAEPGEVDAVFQVPLAFLLDPANHQRRLYSLNGTERYFYAMPYCDPVHNGREFFIWGATAAIIRNFYCLLSQSA